MDVFQQAINLTLSCSGRCGLFYSMEVARIQGAAARAQLVCNADNRSADFWC